VNNYLNTAFFINLLPYVVVPLGSLFVPAIIGHYVKTSVESYHKDTRYLLFSSHYWSNVEISAWLISLGLAVLIIPKIEFLGNYGQQYLLALNIRIRPYSIRVLLFCFLLKCLAYLYYVFVIKGISLEKFIN